MYSLESSLPQQMILEWEEKNRTSQIRTNEYSNNEIPILKEILKRPSLNIKETRTREGRNYSWKVILRVEVCQSQKKRAYLKVEYMWNLKKE